MKSDPGLLGKKQDGKPSQVRCLSSSALNMTSTTVPLAILMSEYGADRNRTILWWRLDPQLERNTY